MSIFPFQINNDFNGPFFEISFNIKNSIKNNSRLQEKFFIFLSTFENWISLLFNHTRITKKKRNKTFFQIEKKRKMLYSDYYFKPRPHLNAASMSQQDTKAFGSVPPLLERCRTIGECLGTPLRRGAAFKCEPGLRPLPKLEKKKEEKNQRSFGE